MNFWIKKVLITFEAKIDSFTFKKCYLRRVQNENLSIGHNYNPCYVIHDKISVSVQVQNQMQVQKFGGESKSINNIKYTFMAADKEKEREKVGVILTNSQKISLFHNWKSDKRRRPCRLFLNIHDNRKNIKRLQTDGQAVQQTVTTEGCLDLF